VTVETYNPDKHTPVLAVDLNSIRDKLVGALVLRDVLSEILGADDRVWALDEDDDVWSARVIRTYDRDPSSDSVWVELRLDDW
jgi:hypothetical protein